MIEMMEGSCLLWSGTHSRSAVSREIKRLRDALDTDIPIDVLLPIGMDEISTDESFRELSVLSESSPVYDHVLFSRPLRLYRTGYSADVIRVAVQFLKPSGVTWFPRNGIDVESGGPPANLQWIEQIFGSRFDLESPDGNLVGWRNPQWSPRPHSIFEIVRRSVHQSAADGDCRLEDSPLGLTSRTLAYQLVGAGYKSAAVSHILSETQSSVCEALHLLSFGGGVGMTELELLASDPRIASVTNVDPDESGTREFGATLFATAVNSKVISSAKEYNHVQESAETYRLHPESLDIVIFFGSLFLVRSGERVGVLRRCWQALRPGGVLVVHESVKSEAFSSTEYFSRMFTSDELDKALTEFGPVSHFDSFFLRYLTREEVADKAVFRFIQKANPE